MKTPHYLIAAIANTLCVFAILPLNVPLAFACAAAAGSGYTLAIMSWNGRLLG